MNGLNRMLFGRAFQSETLRTNMSLPSPLVLMSVVVIATYFTQFHHIYEGFRKQSLRSQTKKFKTAERNYNLMIELAERLTKGREPQRTEIHLFAGLWHPTSTRNVYFVPLAGFFKAWSRAPDAIILPRHPLNRAEYHFTESQTDEDASRFLDELYDHDANLGKCSRHPCYDRLELGGEN